MSWAIWITGLPGSGKSTLARRAASELWALGEPVSVLELDAVRKLLTPAPTYQAAEREIVYRALVAMATALVNAGVPVIIDATAHRRAWRDLARASIARFAEVQIVCPLEVCRDRERRRAPGNAPRFIYGEAGHATAAVPGVDVPYELALDPELVIDTAHEALDSAARRISSLAMELAHGTIAARPRRGAGWAIWVMGPSGSGKSTLVSRVAEALTLKCVPVTVLDFDRFRHLVLGGNPVSPEADEILHRALVATAELLTSAGVPVLIDAAAPRRAWRDLARERIGLFDEVELVCPIEVRRERERRATWRSIPCSGGGLARQWGASLEIDRHEPALKPAVVIRTDHASEWSAAEMIRDLAERLHRIATAAALEVDRGRKSCTSEI